MCGCVCACVCVVVCVCVGVRVCVCLPAYDWEKGLAVVRGNIWELVVIFGNHFLIVFPTNMHQNKRNEVGYPSPKVGEIFWMALEEIHTLEGFILPKTGKLQRYFRGYVGWKQEFSSSALRNFSPNFLEGYPTQFPSFSLIDVGKKQKSWFLKPITGSQRFPLTNDVKGKEATTVLKTVTTNWRKWCVLKFKLF